MVAMLRVNQIGIFSKKLNWPSLNNNLVKRYPGKKKITISAMIRIMYSHIYFAIAISFFTFDHCP